MTVRMQVVGKGLVRKARKRIGVVLWASIGVVAVPFHQLRVVVGIERI